MKLYDISVPFSIGLPVYGEDPPIITTDTDTIAAGGVANVTRFEFSCHTGTHIDAPKHFIDGGKTISDLPLCHFVGPAIVVEAFGKPAMDEGDINAIPGDISGKFILLHTDNGDAMLDGKFRGDYVYITEAAAKSLCERGVKGVGLDYLSVDPFGSKTFPAHMALLGAGMIILEGIRLTGIRPGEYLLSCAPLNIPGGNGFPVRAYLMAD